MANAAVEYAYSAIGTPYVFATPRPISAYTHSVAPSYDCSGLTACAWGAAGVTLVPQSATQYATLSAQGKTRPLTLAQPGDLIFYHYNGVVIDHVAICVGNGTLIEAPEPGEVVRTRSYSPTDAHIVQTVGALTATNSSSTPPTLTANLPSNPVADTVDAVAGGFGIAIIVAVVAGVALLAAFVVPFILKGIR